MLGTYIYIFFFFNDTATTEIYTLSLHDALPISLLQSLHGLLFQFQAARNMLPGRTRSEEHTSELQSRLHLVCRLLLEKKKTTFSHQLTIHSNIDVLDEATCLAILRRAFKDWIRY